MRLNALFYYADFFLSAALILVLAVCMLMEATAAIAAQWLAAASLGFAAWTLVEYFVHRVLYHNVPYFVELHDAHHAEPDAFIGAPAVIGIVLFFLLLYFPISVVSVNAAGGVTAGMLAGYMAYMLLHHAAHHWNVPPGTWLYRARHHHALHHHHSEEGNYGITTPFWDHVFGTALVPSRSGPRRRAA